MTVWEAIILGLVQGLTEFLPVSSSGHLLLAGRIMGLGTLGLGFELVCHLGTLLAVFLVMRKELFALVRKPFSRRMRVLGLASVCTAVIAGFISVFMRDLLEGSLLTYCFIITGILLLCCGFASQKKAEVGYGDAAIIGLMQGVACFPGLSRSGTTIATAQFLGIPRKKAAEFSFILSIPVILGSSIIELSLHGLGGGNVGALAMIAAFGASFIGGLFAVVFILKLLQKGNLDWFAVYLFMLSAFMLINDYALHLF